MKIKQLALFALLVAISVSGFSQEQKNKPAFRPEHEFRLGIGALPVMASNLYYHPWRDDIFGLGNQSIAYDNGLIYSGSQYTTGSISLGYTYNVKKWFSVGGTFSYIGSYRNYFDRTTRAKVGSKNTHDYCITPMVRFTYLNRKYVRLYSQLGLGIGIGTTIENVNGQSTFLSKNYASVQATFFGVSVGNKLFGFTEIGIGAQGVFVAGIGYRFNTKK